MKQDNADVIAAMNDAKVSNTSVSRDMHVKRIE